MAKKDQSLTSQAAPWRTGIAWWLVLLEGIIALIIGVYMIVSPIQATTILGLLMSIFLVINGAIQLYQSLRNKGKGRFVKVAMWRGIIGLAVGAFILVIWLVGVNARDFAIILLWLGLIVYGLLGVYLVIAGRSHRGGIRWSVLLGSVIILLFGLLVAYDDFTDTGLINVIAVLMVVLGILLILLGLGRRIAADSYGAS